MCSDWVWPCVAAIASIAVRTTLLNTSWAASDQPEVWQWVRSAIVTASSVGRASASSSELVCSDCVPPSTAARACSEVRTTLL